MSNGVGRDQLVTKDKLIIKKVFMTKERFEMEQEIKKKDLKGPDWLISAQ